MLKLLTMAASITFMKVKNLSNLSCSCKLKKLEEQSNHLSELDLTVKFLNNSCEELLKQTKKHNVSTFLKKIIRFPLSEQQ